MYPITILHLLLALASLSTGSESSLSLYERFTPSSKYRIPQVNSKTPSKTSSKLPPKASSLLSPSSPESSRPSKYPFKHQANKFAFKDPTRTDLPKRITPKPASNPISNKLRDLVLRTYVKEVDAQKGEAVQKPSLGLNERLMQIYTRTQNYLCTNVPFVARITCPRPQPQEKSPAISPLRPRPRPRLPQKGAKVTAMHSEGGKDEGGKTCANDGRYVPAIRNCLVHRTEEVTYREAKSICRFQYPKGEIWTGMSGAKESAALLHWFGVEDEEYSAWISSDDPHRPRALVTSPDAASTFKTLNRTSRRSYFCAFPAVGTLTIPSHSGNEGLGNAFKRLSEALH